MRNKTLTILLLTTILFDPATDLRAAPSNGTRLPPGRSVELGYEYNVMFKRQLNRSYGDLSNQDHFYTVSFGAFDWLSLDGKIGIGDVTQKNGSHLPKLEYNTGFAGGYGFRIKAFEEKRYGVRLIAGFQHISVHPRDRSVNDDKYESFLDDWQVSALAAKDFKFFTLYAGMKGSDCEIVYKVNKHDKRRRYSENHIGLISGGELYLFDNKARLGVEGRFFDETAFSTSVSYLF
ncbi:MAG: hypothetical protein Q8N91_00660 [Candidatus Omnitrophota bacterium]|nr:hypothetical protein [Candidatus Omnitrophota bacterium]